jgi:hypothetical protein
MFGWMEGAEGSAGKELTRSGASRFQNSSTILILYRETPWNGL